MKLRKNFIVAIFLLGTMCVGCSANSTGEENPSSVGTSTPIPGEGTGIENLAETPVTIHVFTQEDMIVTPEIKEYDFPTAQETGSVKKVQGMLPGTAEGTWYIIEINGIEYYYGKYDYDTSEKLYFWGYSIISDQYSLANGLSVGMTKEEVLSEYPDMAIVEFDGITTENGVTGYLGWNGAAYPRSYMGMDREWDYAGKDYAWTDQFEYAMIADIDLGEADTLPKYLGLLMENDTVAAITFYYPTAD